MPRWLVKPEPALDAFWSLTAASSRVESGDARRERAAAQYGWQLASLRYSEELGEIWYASKFYERALRNLKLIVQRKQDDGTWKKDDTPELNSILGGLTDANGEQSSLLGMYGRQFFLTGEARLFGTYDPDTGADVWEMLSVEELYVNSEGKYIRRRAPGEQPETIEPAPPDVFRPTGDGAVMFRLWNPSPRWSLIADSPMRGVQVICNELELLTRGVRGEIISRLSNNGILGIPSELDLPVLAQGVRPDEDPGASTFMRRLEDALMIGIKDESSAASQIPVIVRGPGDLLAKMIHIRFDKPLGDEMAKRDECVKRLSLSLDMPPEALLGISDTNHWGAWQIDESSWKVHIQPVAQTLVENLTSSWFRPITQDAMLRIWYDESEVVNHPDRSTDFKAANEAYVISNEAYRKSIGATEDDAMSPEEQDRMAQLKALAHRGSDATVTPSATSPNAAPADATTPGSSTPDTAPTSTPPAATSGPPGPQGVPGVAKSLAAAESAVWRCREVAGSRLRSKVDRAAFKAIANPDLAHALGREDVQNPDALVAGGGALFSRQLCGYGVPPDLAAAIVTRAEEHARDTLFDADPGDLPDDLIAMCTLGSLSGTPA